MTRSPGAGGPAALAGVANAARPLTLAVGQLLPVVSPLAPLFPQGGLRRGSTVMVTSSPGAGGGSSSLSLALAVAASQAGSWCASVAMPALGAAAAAELGIALERFVLVPHPGERWPTVVALVVDAVDVVLLRPPGRVRSGDARRLAARVRERGGILILAGEAWPETVDLRLSAASLGWRGLEWGHGYLQARLVEVTATGRGAASRECRVKLWLPGPDGTAGAIGMERQAWEAGVG